MTVSAPAMAMRRRTFLLACAGAGGLASAPVGAAALRWSDPEPGRALTSIPANDFVGMTVLEPRAGSSDLLWSAGRAPFDQIRLTLRRRATGRVLTLEKRSLSHGGCTLDYEVPNRGSSIRIAFRQSSTAGLALYVAGRAVATDSTPAAKAGIAVASPGRSSARSPQPMRVTLFSDVAHSVRRRQPVEESV